MLFLSKKDSYIINAIITKAVGKEYEITENWIPMHDDVQLAADLYWPSDYKEGEVYPVLLEYIPYRKDESRGRNYPLYSHGQKKILIKKKTQSLST